MTPQNRLDPDSPRTLVDLGLQNSRRQLESLFHSSNFNSEGAQGIAVFRLDDRRVKPVLGRHERVVRINLMRYH